MTTKYQMLIVGLSGAIAVALGALGAHALKGQLETGLISLSELGAFDTASKYQLFHTLAMLVVLIWNEKLNSKILVRAYQFFLLGIIFFSGSLYFLTTRHLLGAEWLRFLGPVTPLGGLFFIAGWLCIAFSMFKKVNS